MLNAYVCPPMTKAIFFCIIISISIISLFGGSGCANIVPPAGGPKDTVPPRLVRAEPRDSTVNFSGKHVTLTFDENIDLKQQDLTDNVLFTPTFDKNPEIKVKGHNMTLTFQDSLIPNTTYVLNFGNAIKDLSEGNPIHDFSYTFSTGPALDSLEMNGRVILAETGGIDTNLMAMLHRDLSDSAIVKTNPMYMVRLDHNGAFHFKHLPKDTFALYILGDVGFSKRYNAATKTQLFAFLNNPVVAGVSDSLVLYAYREAQPLLRNAANTNAPRIPPNDRRLRFTLVTQGPHDLLEDFVLNFPVPLRTFDSTRLQLTMDSIFTATPFSASLDSTKTALHIRSQWKENTRYNLVLNRDFAADTAGRQLLKTDTVFFNTRKQSDYGNLVIRLRNVDLSKNPVLQFVQNNAVVFSSPVRDGTFSRPLFLPGEYELRVLYDTNGNGKWDPGHFFGTKKQPEIVHPVAQKITVKPNWDNEFERNL